MTIALRVMALQTARAFNPRLPAKGKAVGRNAPSNFLSFTKQESIMERTTWRVTYYNAVGRQKVITVKAKDEEEAIAQLPAYARDRVEVTRA